MCRTGGRRCSGSSGKAKAKLRQQIHRARRAVNTARAAGDTAAVAAGEARIQAATTALNKLKEQDTQARETAAQQGDVTPPRTVEHDTAERVAVVNTNHGGTVGIQGDVVTGVGVVIGSSFGPVHTGDGVQINRGSWGEVDGDRDAEYREARQVARAARKEARRLRHEARQERLAAQAGDVTDDNTGRGVHMGSGRNDDNVRFGKISNNTGVVMGSNSGGIFLGGSASTGGQSSPGDDAERAAKAARKAEKKARKKAVEKERQVSGGSGDVIIGRNVGGVVQGNGYTVVGGSVYRHPGRSVSVRGTVVTDAATGQPLTPTHTAPSTGRGHTVIYQGGVLYVNGQRVD
ncbi:hypothetical protein [Kutzneria sp. 744]|uniref:hypothetical protein n=1 Tax=Kutzneria sp. (strain 744) TaxID=345341 RepID=UPI0003EEB203|nr:hypothetical protein [Kutzneria sp. 744]EWM14605.1 LigA protein [Kutzneria sp. 744]